MARLQIPTGDPNLQSRWQMSGSRILEQVYPVDCMGRHYSAPTRFGVVGVEDLESKIRETFVGDNEGCFHV